ncbi:MAG TPA: ABC transporter permease [Planctomycetaceae bacterium]|nr:ABC transporter permease [Planctomycetaceae bacterium]
MNWLGRTLRDAVLPPIVLLAVVAVVWDRAVVAYDIKPYLLPRPGLVANAVWSNHLKLLGAIRYTGTAAVCGLALSLVVGTAVSFAFSQSRWLRSAGYPYALFLQTVPIVAIAPLLVYWCGQGFQSVVLTAFIISLFPIIAGGTTGLLSVEPDLVDLFRLHNATRWQTLWMLRTPNAVPALCTGLKTSCGLAVVGAVVGEYFAGQVGLQNGLGYLIQFHIAGLKMADLFAAVLASTALTVAMFGVTSVATAAILARWYDVPAEHRT